MTDPHTPTVSEFYLLQRHLGWTADDVRAMPWHERANALACIADHLDAAQHHPTPPPRKDPVMPLPLWARYLIGALLAAVIGYLVDAYVPLQPLAHIAAIVLYVIAAIAAVAGIYLLIFAPAGHGTGRPPY